MIEALPLPNQDKRLASLHALKLLDTPIEERFERITRMVCRLLDVPIALFNLIDDHRQFYKSAQGLQNTEAALDGAFCTHALHEKKMLLVPNAHDDIRFHDNPFVNGERLDVGFYAGCVVHAPDGMPVGTLCAIDRKPREMTHDQIQALNDLAAMVETELRVASLSKIQAGLIEELNEANHLALVDPLTRLWNRNGMQALIDKEWAVAQRLDRPITLIMGDIDHFKKVNDTFGHLGGDIVLKQVAKRLLNALRGEDAVGRMGGEEFLMVLTDSKPEEIFETAERIRKTVCDEVIHIEGATHPVTISLGVATCYPAKADDQLAIIKRADDALYQAKNSGRNKSVVAA